MLILDNGQVVGAINVVPLKRFWEVFDSHPLAVATDERLRLDIGSDSARSVLADSSKGIFGTVYDGSE